MSDWNAPQPVYRLGPYREFAPEREFVGTVEVAWCHAAPDAAPHAVAPPHRVLPENGVSVALRCVRRSDGRLAGGELVVIGPVSRSRMYAPARGDRLEAIRLRPEWCRSLLGFDPQDHADCLTPLRAIDRRRADRWLDVLRRTLGLERSLRTLASLVTAGEPASATDRATHLAHAVLEHLRAGRRRLLLVAEALGVTDRHARRVVRDVIGVNPARFARVHRLNVVMRAADGVDHPNWARLACGSGFYDQSHLIATCRALTGRSVAALHHERREQSRFAEPFPRDELRRTARPHSSSGLARQRVS